MRTFNLTDILTEAENAEDNSREDFIVPEDGKVYPEATIVHSQWRLDDAGRPSWWIIIKTEDGSFPLALRFTTVDFANKRTFSNLRAVGVNDFQNLDPEVVNELLKGSQVRVKVKWGKNKTGGDPWANHTLHPVERDIPEPPVDDEDDDF